MYDRYCFNFLSYINIKRKKIFILIIIVSVCILFNAIDVCGQIWKLSTPVPATKVSFIKENGSKINQSEYAFLNPVETGASLFFISNYQAIPSIYAPLRMFGMNPESQIHRIGLYGVRTKWNGNNLGQPFRKFININGVASSYNGGVVYSRDVSFKNKYRKRLFRATLDKRSQLINEKPLVFGDEDDYNPIEPALSPNGLYLYFASNNNTGGPENFDLYYCKRLDETTFSSPKNLGRLVNTPDNELFPYVDFEGNLFFSSNKKGGYGGLDIYFVKMEDGMPVGNPVNIGMPFNSPFDDFSFTASVRLNSIFFSSTRGSKLPQLYRVKVNLDSILNSEKNYIKGYVLDSHSKLGIDSVELSIRDLDSGIMYKPIIFSSGYFISDLKKESHYRVLAKRSGYKNYSIDVKSDTLSYHYLLILMRKDEQDSLSSAGIKNQPINKPVHEDEISKPQPSNSTSFIDSIKTKAMYSAPFYFGFNSDTIRNIDINKIEELANLLKKAPESAVWIVGFADCKGNIQVNNILSEKRAKEIKKELLKRGISSKRIICDHYGKQLLFVPCKEDSAYNRGEQVRNRRVEMIVANNKEQAKNLSKLFRKKVTDSTAKKTDKKRTAAPQHTDNNRNALPPQSEASPNDTLKPYSKISGIFNKLPNRVREDERDILNIMARRNTKDTFYFETKFDSVWVDVYDNGVFDGDSVSIIYNNKLLVDKQLLKTEVPIRLHLALNAGSNNRLILIADNEGEIPPNAALMVIRDQQGKARKEVPVSNNLNTKTVIVFIKKPF
jgi:Outer membrane protein and related peptidoglycan-associated (lipo)proteins